LKARLLTPSVACVLGAFALAGCGSSSSSSTTDTTATATTPTTATTPATGVSAPAKATASAKLTLQADPAGMLAFQQTKLTASAGSVTIVFENASSVPHNVMIADSTGKIVGSTPTITAASRTLTLKLAKGAYTYYCGVPGHRQAGMQGTLTIN
jgi:plastocyanin